MDIYLPIAGMSINFFLVLGIGGLVGFLSGLFGIGGGFLLTPLLIMIGIPPTVAAASDSNQIVAASASGVCAHLRRGNVDFRMGLLLLSGGIVGGSLGVQLIKWLRHTGNADFFIRMCYVVMLGIIGSYMFVESFDKLRPGSRPGPAAPRESKGWFGRISDRLPYRIRFERSGVTMSPVIPALFGIFVGVLSAIMGVGGGFIMVPVMVYMLRMPMHVVVGTSLFQIMFTSVNITFMQAYSNHTVDFVLALLLMVGSALGAQVGARLGSRLKGDQLKILLSVIVLVVMCKMLFDLALSPVSRLAPAGGH